MEGSSWDESLETGNAFIDSQHRELIALVDELKQVASESDDRVFQVLGRVMDFAVDHFHAEEDLMEQVEYPPLPTQQMVEGHTEFKSYARLRVIEFRRGETLSVLPLHGFIEEFLKVHEFGMDRQLARWIRGRDGFAAGRP